MESHPHRDVIPEEPRQDRAGNYLHRWQRETSPASIGFTRGVYGKLVLSETAQLLDHCLIVFSNNVFLEQILGFSPKAALSLISDESLIEIAEDKVDADHYKYKMLFYSGFWRRVLQPGGKIFVDTGRDLTEEYRYWK